MSVTQSLSDPFVRELRVFAWRVASKFPTLIARLRMTFERFFGSFYRADGMAIHGRNLSFLKEPQFKTAYQLGMQSGHKILRSKGSEADIHIEWRVHMACWAASHATHLEGDFVECGVNTGILSRSICHYIDFNSSKKRFFLFDTYNGVPESQMAATEKNKRIEENRFFYDDCYEQSLKNFLPFPNAILVRGVVPDSLTMVDIPKVCYLSLDMNIAYPELKAIEYFWDKMVSGAPILLDDYGSLRYAPQKEAMDSFAETKGVKIATLPTAQGLLIKP